jgi:hypothetical protein
VRRLAAYLLVAGLAVGLAGGAPRPASGAGPLGCPAGSPNFESRGWWTPAGVSIDEYRGIDMEVCAPARLSGDVPITLHVQLRHNFATITFLRVQIAGAYGQVVAFQQDVRLAGDPVTGDGEWFIAATLHSQVAPQDGWQELRFTANIARDEFGKRQYQSTGLQAYVANGKTVKPAYRAMPWWEARGWYVGYENVRLRQDPPASAVSGLWSVRWDAVAGSGGTPITYHAGYVDANTHAIPMVLPVTFSAGSGAFSGTSVIDTTRLANGTHKLLLRADSTTSAGTTSGLLQILFVVANGSGTPAPTASPSPSVIVTPQPTPTPTPTPIPSSCGAPA